MRSLYTLMLTATLALLPAGLAQADGASSSGELLEQLAVESAEAAGAYGAVARYFEARATQARSDAAQQRALIESLTADYQGDMGDLMIREFDRQFAADLAARLDEKAADYERRAAKYQKRR